MLLRLPRALIRSLTFRKQRVHPIHSRAGYGAASQVIDSRADRLEVTLPYPRGLAKNFAARLIPNFEPIHKPPKVVT
jgi:hypothetical protein